MSTTSNRSLDLKAFITGIVSSIADSQNQMDRNSIKTAVRLLEEGLTSQSGLTSRWYAIPEAEVVIKMLLEISKERELKSQMLNAAYASRYDIDSSLSSDFNLKIKRVPVDENLNLTVRNETEIIAKVSKLREVAKKLHRFKNGFLNASYKPFQNNRSYTGGRWFIEVLHPPEAGSSQTSGLILSALIIVDDKTGEIITAKYYDNQ
ncbi:MAG: hypothetical protein RIM99_10215 [Cyclobacteriaceae bacterium]